MSKVPLPKFPVVAEPGAPCVFGDNRAERAGRPPVARGFPRALPLTVTVVQDIRSAEGGFGMETNEARGR
jgi:hypothetical protein